MTPEMVFECLLVSEDIQVLSLMNCALERLSIEIEHCTDPLRGQEVLAKRDVDLLVCDCKGAPSEMKLLNEVLTSDHKRTATVLTVVDGPLLAISAKNAGAHVVIQKPLTRESSAQGLKVAYSRMVREQRSNTRRAIMRRVLATNRCGEFFPITVTDINERGVGLCAKQKIDVGDLLSFDLALPNAALPINVKVRVLWMRHNLAGADFERISDPDRLLLHAWLKDRVRRDGPAQT